MGYAYTHTQRRKDYQLEIIPMSDRAENTSISNLVSYLRDTLDERHDNGWSEAFLRDSVQEIIRNTIDDNDEDVLEVRRSGIFENDDALMKYCVKNADEWFDENNFDDTPKPDEYDGSSVSHGR